MRSPGEQAQPVTGAQPAHRHLPRRGHREQEQGGIGLEFGQLLEGRRVRKRARSFKKRRSNEPQQHFTGS